MGRGLRAFLPLTLALAAPGLIAVTMLTFYGAVADEAAIAAFCAVLFVAAAIAAPAALSVGALVAATERLGPDADPAAAISSAWRLVPVAGAVWAAILRLRRAWRGRALELSASLEASDAVMAAVPEPLILIDRNRRIVRANAAARGFVGTVSEPRDLAASLRNPLLLAAVDAVLRGEASRIVEFEMSVPLVRVLEGRLARIVGPSPEGAVAVLTLHDITASRRAEQMRADFVANAGHELKTPLASLVGFIETLLGPARDDAAAGERFLGIMREQAGRMARLVDDLLSLSRIELNEHVPPTARVALAPVIERVAAGLELRAAARQMRIVLSLPEELPDITGDGDELAQVFQNLFDNAIKYGRPKTEIKVSAALADGLIGIAVSDRGEGIAGEHLPRLTERFYRVDSARSRELGGTGLGLAIVKHVLNRHRGRLDIESSPGKGSTFTAWLRAAMPLDEVSATPERHEPSPKIASEIR